MASCRDADAGVAGDPGRHWPRSVRAARTVRMVRMVRLAGVAVLVATLAASAWLGWAGGRDEPAVAPAQAAGVVNPISASVKARVVLPRLYSADLALGLVIGYAFADGQISAGTYTYEQGGDGLADQFRAAILDAGGAVAPHGPYAASSVGLPDLGMVTHGPLPASVLGGSADLRRGVLASIVQCEGDPAGLVWDSPSREASQSVVELLATFGIAARLRGTAFFDVVVGPESFAFFQGLPVALRDRLPGSPLP